MKPIVLFIKILSTFLISLISFYLYIKIAHKRGILDHPNGRKIHPFPVVTSGGVIIFISLWLGIFLFFHNTVFASRVVIHTLILSSFALIVGFVDDIVDIRARFKLTMQTLLAIGVILLGYAPPALNFVLFRVKNPIIIYAFTIFFIVSTINAINFIDGADGLASGTVLIILLSFIVLFRTIGSSMETHIVFEFTAVIIGFLIFNMHPAKLFMGDSGSTFLGFMLSMFFLILSRKTGSFPVFPALIFLFYPFADVSAAIIRRRMARQSIFIADKKHLHHILLSKSLNYNSAIIMLWTLNALLQLAGIISMHHELFSLVFFTGMFIFTILSLTMVKLFHVQHS